MKWIEELPKSAMHGMQAKNNSWLILHDFQDGRYHVNIYDNITGDRTHCFNELDLLSAQCVLLQFCADNEDYS